MPSYAVTTFDNLDYLQRERALERLAFNESFEGFRVDTTGTTDGDNFLSRLMSRFSIDLEASPDVAAFISSEAEKHHIWFGLKTGTPIHQEMI